MLLVANGCLIMHDLHTYQMSTPGVEPGLSRPQRDVLTTRRCGRGISLAPANMVAGCHEKKRALPIVAVQILGGMGYSAETRAERAYRDSRINRIFEGTNEINRMLTVDMILKKAMKGEIDLVTHAMAVSEEIMGIPDFQPPSNDVFERHLEYIKKFKKAILMVAGAAQNLMMSLAKEQEIIMGIADMAIWPWYGKVVLEDVYGSAEFLQVQEYSHLLRWAEEISERAAVKRGLIIDQAFGDMKLLERHSSADVDAALTFQG